MSEYPMVIGHYRIHEQLGRGTFGEVYRATDLDDPTYHVAIKILHAVFAQDPTFTSALRRERHLLSSLTHPGIVQVRDLVHEEGRMALILEFLQGEDLHTLLERGPMGVETIASLTEQLLNALAYAHSHRPPVVHRDLKPSNLFITSQGQLKLVDFGIARAADGSAASRTGHLNSGTCAYMAPEIWEGHKSAPAMDIYAAGLILFEMIVGRAACPPAAMPAMMAWHTSGSLQDPRGLRPDVPIWLSELTKRMADPDPTRRPSDGGAALSLMHELRGGRDRRPAKEAAKAVVTGTAQGPGRWASNLLHSGLLLKVAITGALGVGCLGAAGAMAWRLHAGGVEPPPIVAEPVPALPPSPEPAPCSDIGATEPFAGAAQAWHTCRFDLALNVYGSSDAAGQPEGVQSCAGERHAAMAEQSEGLTRIGQWVGAGRCHAASTALTELASFEASPACLEHIRDCEAQEKRAINAEVSRSEAELEDSIVDGTIITGVDFRPVPGDPWQWDIVVPGAWTFYFTLMATAGESGDTAGQAVAIQQAVILTQLSGTVGDLSQKTRWRSRLLVFEDDGQCVYTVPTAKAREVSRRLRRAAGTSDFAEAITWTISQLKSC